MVYQMKIILLGASNVGKSSIFVRYFENTWNRQIHKSTIGQDFKCKKITRGGEEYMLHVWDTAGSERYDAITPVIYRNADYAILCFDYSELNTWNKLIYWYEELQKNEENCKVVICATKKDMFDNNEREYRVNQEEVKEYVTLIGAMYIHVSSRTGENVESLFNIIIDKASQDPNLKNRMTRRVEEGLLRTKEENMRQEVRREVGGCCARLNSLFY